MITEPVAVSLISAISAIAIAYVVNVAAKRVQEKKTHSGPIDRMESMFDGYERLIKQKDAEDTRKGELIKDLKDEITRLHNMAKSLEASLERSKAEHERSKDDNDELREMLRLMREEYKELRKAD